MENGELSRSIDASYDAEKVKDYRSRRIGASIVGHPCDAYIAMTIRGFGELQSSPHLKRIFRDGHRIELTVIDDLKKAGHSILEKDIMTGEQFEWNAYFGYVVYKADGILANGDNATLLEVKSMNDSCWKRFQSRGLKVSHPKYVDQVQLGMGMSGITKAIVIGYNKDNSQYWDEVIEFDPIAYSLLLTKIERVLLDGGKQRCATTKADWRCKECSKRLLCWDKAPVVEDRRTCAHSSPGIGGWNCDLGKATCDGCTQYERFTPEDKQ